MIAGTPTHRGSIGAAEGSVRYAITSGDDLTPSQFLGVVALHGAALQGGFSASLGTRALRVFYEHVAASEKAVLVVACEGTGTDVLGFISASVDTAPLYKEFLRRKLPQAILSSWPHLLSPRSLRGVIEVFAHPRKSERRGLPSAEVLSFAVTSARRGSGLASELFCHCMTCLKGKGVRSVRIVTGTAQGRAHAFYEKMGARRLGAVSLHRGEECFVYVYDIP